MSEPEGVTHWPWKQTPPGTLVRDDEGHWYFIPVKRFEEFEYARELDDPVCLEAFQKHRIEHPSNYVWIMKDPE